MDINKILIENSSLVVGSAPEAVCVSDADIPRSVFTVAVNNAWRLRPDFRVHVAPNDFPAANSPPPSYPAIQIRNVGYAPALRRAGGVLFSGTTMSVCAGYYTMHSWHNRIVTFVGCNMVYGGSQTHFYGKGDADPLKKEPWVYPSIKNLPAKTSRMFLIALLMDTLMINLLPLPGSLLHIPTTRHAGDITDQYRAIMADKEVHRLLAQATSIWMQERHFPADRHTTNFTPIAQDPQLMAFIDGINDQWLNLGRDALGVLDTYLN